MRKRFLKSKKKPVVKRQGVIHFDTEQYKPSPESLEIYDELTAIAKEIEECRQRNLQS
jgi:hypothetical protein